MAKVPDSSLETLTFVNGVDNRSAETKVGNGSARAADNVDIDQDGVVSIRDGYTQLNNLIGAHSLWSHDLMMFALVADGTTLYSMAPDGATTALVAGLNGNDLGYAVIANRVYWSNNVQTGIVKLSGVVMPWGVETPLPSFTLTATANGGMDAGTYGVTMTFANIEREEGGAPDTVFVNVPPGGGIQINNIPSPQKSGPTIARIYMSTANGTELQYVASAAPGTSTYFLGVAQYGRQLTTQYLEPFPPTRWPIAKYGRLFGAWQDRTLVWSQAMYYGLFHPTFNSMRFPDPITMIACPETPQFCMFIGTKKKVYMLQGESIDTATQSIVSNHGAIPGSMAMVPQYALEDDATDTPVPLWAGTDGVPYMGSPGGIKAMSKIFTYPIYDKAAATFFQKDRISRYIVSGRGGRVSGLQAIDTAIATVYDNGGGS